MVDVCVDDRKDIPETGGSRLQLSIAEARKCKCKLSLEARNNMGMVILILLAVIGLFVILPLVGSIFELALVLLVWAAIGWLAGQLLRGRGYGAIGNIVLGLGGGIVGRLLFGLFAPGMAAGLVGTLLAGVVGAVVLVYAVRLLGVNPSFGR